jgi:hypothetical protein
MLPEPCCRTDFHYPDPRYPAVACYAITGRTAAGCSVKWGQTTNPCVEYEDKGTCVVTPKSAVLGVAILGYAVLGKDS